MRDTIVKDFAAEIEGVAGEEILGVRMSPGRGYYYNYDYDYDYDDPDAPPKVEDRVYSWAEAKPILTYAYDAGFGGLDSHAIYAWTENWVIFVHEYDGAPGPQRVPRNPGMLGSPQVNGERPVIRAQREKS